MKRTPSNSCLTPANNPKKLTPLSKQPIANKSTGRLSPPPSTKSGKSSSMGTKPTKTNQSTPKTDEERIDSLLTKILQVDPNDHERRAILMNSLPLFMSQKNPKLTHVQMTLLLDVLFSIFSTPPPFSIITKSYRKIFFNPRDHPSDVAVGYKILKIILPLNPPVSNDFLRALMRRMTSASNEDRNGAFQSLKKFADRHAPLLIHLLALTLIPPPPHGISMLLELAVFLLKSYKAPPPLFDDFFVTTSFDEGINVHSIMAPISQPKLNDGITIFEELQCTFRLLHFAPHYQTFSQQIIEALKALHEYNEEFAHQNRKFLLNHWPRLDPPKAVLFMQEATEICSHGPPVDEVVWQNFSWRSSSIQWQIAMEGLNFVQSTIDRMEGFDHSVLRYLLIDASTHHWNNSVRKKASEVLLLLPEVEPVPPPTLPVTTWNMIKKVAKENYPDSEFSARRPARKRTPRK